MHLRKQIWRNVMSNYQKYTLCNRKAQCGFTLVELVGVSAIIAVLIGLLLPVAQKAREALNVQRATQHLREIFHAEEQYFVEEERHGSSPSVYTNDFVKLHLESEFPCADPNCGFRQNNGYLYRITLGPNGQTFTAEAMPAVVGKTGSTRLVTDQTGGIFTAPLPEAESVHKQMFDNINAAAVQTLLRLILQRPQDLPEITRGVESQRTTERAFNQLDVNGDGRVSFTDLNNYSGVGADVINPFLAIINREMALGAGGEDVNLLPGLTFDGIWIDEFSHVILNYHWDQEHPGLSDSSSAPAPPAPSPTPTPPPTIRLAAFAGGSVRSVNGDRDG